MENIKYNYKETEPNPKERLMETFYRELVTLASEERPVISAAKLAELAEKGITAEEFLDYVSRSKGVLLHGSATEIEGDLVSRNEKIFASDRSAIAIMRSIYTNQGAHLEYPYHISEANPLALRVVSDTGTEYKAGETGWVYLVESEGFENEPTGSWQYVKRSDSARVLAAVETSKKDFTYPVEIK